MDELRDVLVEAIREAEITLARRRAALMGYDGMMRPIDDHDRLLEQHEAEPTPAPSNATNDRPNRRSSDEVEALSAAVRKLVLTASSETVRVVEVHRSLVDAGLLTAKASDREFVRYLLRKLANAQQITNKGKGRFGKPFAFADPKEGVQ